MQERTFAAMDRKDHKNRRGQEDVSGMIVSGIIRNFLIPTTNIPLTPVSAEVLAELSVSSPKQKLSPFSNRRHLYADAGTG
jgi:hypothetical protein